MTIQSYTAITMSALWGFMNRTLIDIDTANRIADLAKHTSPDLALSAACSHVRRRDILQQFDAAHRQPIKDLP